MIVLLLQLHLCLLRHEQFGHNWAISPLATVTKCCLCDELTPFLYGHTLRTRQLPPYLVSGNRCVNNLFEHFGVIIVLAPAR